MVGALDFNSFAGIPSSGDNRIAAWYWRGLSSLNSTGCSGCGNVKFGGDLFTNTDPYYNPENSLGVGFLAPQKVGPIPLGDECGPAGLSTGNPPPKSCPENGIATNGDFMTQVSQAQGHLWAPMSTEVNQVFNPGVGQTNEIHAGAIYWVLGTASYDRHGYISITNQGYASAAHEELEMPAIAAEGTGGNGKAILLSTLSGNGGYSAPYNAGSIPAPPTDG
jgi:hypothetical protein